MIVDFGIPVMKSSYDIEVSVEAAYLPEQSEPAEKQITSGALFLQTPAAASGLHDCEPKHIKNGEHNSANKLAS